MKAAGKVFLVGAGPGDPDLLTLRAAELLRRADVVVHGIGIPRAVLDLAPARAEQLEVGKSDVRSPTTPDQLGACLVRKAHEGKLVVRLLPGDPYASGPGAEEAQFLAAAGIEFEVVPGVSAAAALLNYAGIPLTHPACTSTYTVVSHPEQAGPKPARVDWAHVARAPGTLVVLTDLDRVREAALQLQQHGRPPATPAAVVLWNGNGGIERTAVYSSLAGLAGPVELPCLVSPALLVLGDVVKLHAALNWVERRPLAGQRVVVTRSREQAPELARPLRERGADVLEIPTIRIETSAQPDAMAEALRSLNAYDWIIFTSANGVRSFFDAFYEAYRDLRELGGARIAAVGPGTASRLREQHVEIDLLPEENTGTHIAKALKDFESVENLRLLLPRAEAASPDLPRLLEEAGAIVDDIPFYRTVAETGETPEATRLREDGVQWITFTSGSTVQQFHRRFDLIALLKRFPDLKLASIGPETSKAIRSLNLKVSAEAAPHTLEGLISALEKAARHEHRAR